MRSVIKKGRERKGGGPFFFFFFCCCWDGNRSFNCTGANQVCTELENVG